MTKLSVNLNKVALLRNQRDIGYPSVIQTAEIVLDAGAHGITVHPRPDERHIRRTDVGEISAFLKNRGDDGAEFNIEGYPDDSFLALVTEQSCDQVTLVPDAPGQRTSDHGWDIAAHKDLLKTAIDRLRKEGRRVSLFIDPDPEAAILAAEVGANRIELYTGPYAFKPDDTKLLDQYIRTTQQAEKEGLEINAGHDLNLDNLARFIAAVPSCAEVSIGHAITADALEMGWRGAVQAYLTAIEYGRKAAGTVPEKKVS